jgi:hypothetical protein
VQTSFPPSKVGLPSYLDQKAGSYIHLPNVDFDAYSDFTRGYPGFARYSVGTLRGELSKYIGTHAFRFGMDIRDNWRASNGPGQQLWQFRLRQHLCAPGAEHDQCFQHRAAMGGIYVGVP